ncbi:MAG: hypothetical protein ACXVCO_20710, partial [Ktedonobacterales bacterium]
RRHCHAARSEPGGGRGSGRGSPDSDYAQATYVTNSPCACVYSPGTARHPAKQCFGVLALPKTAERADEQIEREMARLRIVKDDTCNHDSSGV